jgi:hypothetical protein
LLDEQFPSVQEKMWQMVSALDLDKAELAQVLARAPSLLSRDLSCLRRTYTTLLATIGEPQHVRGIIVRCPEVCPFA